ncbi:MAG: mechanosensitive ion channel family protein [Candidatus Loosdrechtia sp.]|uniref:mechanosensitive ion channel family protein n=1 Tax=Candidatus Loosdrechtia sp. TaxID=3101272 RepID=UPI003A754503|nr:MAG: mechanosensitive ion channel [Candidatus Jettenia sp. AMX2]
MDKFSKPVAEWTLPEPTDDWNQRQANTFSDQIAGWLKEVPGHYLQIVESLIVIIVLILIHIIAIRIVYKKIDDPVVQYKWKKKLGYLLSFFGFLIIGHIWFEGVGSLTTFVGLVSAGLAIALREPLVDIAGWVFLLWNKPFDVGDRIQIGDIKGDVIDIRLFKFSLLEIGNWVHADQSTGRIIHVPNHNIFRDAIANYTSEIDFIWNEIEVVVTFESDWKKAKQILQEIANEHLKDFVEDAEAQTRRAAEHYLIHYHHLTPIVYTEVVRDGIKLTVRHLTKPRHKRNTSQMIWEDILDRFNKAKDIDFAYQTTRVFQNKFEGKPNLRRGK